MTAHNVLQDIADSTELEILDPGDAGTIAIDRSFGICAIVTAGAETRKIATPQRAGIFVTLCLKTDGGDATVTGSGSEILNSGSGTDTTVTLGDVGDAVTLLSIDKSGSIVWTLIANNGVTFS